jgi:hypothetical protein
LLKNTELQAAQKDLRGEAREKSTSGGVLSRYVGASRLSATKHMSLFQQPATRPVHFMFLSARVTTLPSFIAAHDNGLIKVNSTLMNQLLT